MKARLLLGIAAVALLALPQWSYAQEDEAHEGAELAAVSYWRLDPEDMGDFMTVAAKVVQAAREANLPAEYGWHMWQDMFTVTLVGQFSEAELNDPEHWMKQFMGTPGEATLMSAFQEMESIDWIEARSEIHQHMPNWTYTPEGMSAPPMAWVRVHEFWPKSGMENQQKWGALIEEFMAFFKEIGYPYPIWGNMVRYGDNRNIFVTAYDDPAAYMGENSAEALAAIQGKGEKWQELLMRLGQLVNRGEISDHSFMAEQSYMPELDEMAAR